MKIINSCKKVFIMLFVQDTFVGRDCEVFYDIARPNTTSDTIWVTKQFSLDNCKKPLIHDDLLRIANEPRKDIEKPKNLRSSFVTMLNMTAEGKPFIFEMVAEGRYTMTMFTPNHGEAITYTRQICYFKIGYFFSKLF